MVQITEYSSKEEADDAKKLGNEAFQRKEYDKACEWYTKAIDIHDGSLHVYYSNRAACHLALSAWEAGLEDATKCVSINPNFIKGYFRQIVALCELGKVCEAKEIMDKVQQMDNLSKAELGDMQRLQESIAVAEERGTPSESSPQKPLECSWDAGDLGFDMKRLGNDAYKGGLFDAAVEHYTEAIERLDAEGLDQEVAIVRNNRAACFQQLGNHECVVEDCTEALAMMPGNVKALTRRGLAYEVLEQFENALEDMVAALKEDPRSVIAGQARSRLQRLVKAKEAEYVLVCPDSPSAAIGVPNWAELEIDEITV